MYEKLSIGTVLGGIGNALKQDDEPGDHISFHLAAYRIDRPSWGQIIEVFQVVSRERTRGHDVLLSD